MGKSHSMNHKLERKLMSTQALMDRLVGESRGSQFAVCLQARSGEMTWVGDGVSPSTPQQFFAQELLRKLNREVHLDGAWVFQWINLEAPSLILLAGGLYKDFNLLFIDQDGDVQFTIECGRDDQFHHMVEAGTDHWVGQAVEAWKRWHYHMRETIDPSSDQLFKEAQGESPSHH